MFGAVYQMANNLKEINGRSLVSEVVNEPSIQSQMIDLNQEQLYEKGIDSKGKSTGKYAAATIYGTTRFEGKIAKGQRYDHITLKDSGASYDSMKVQSTDGDITIRANFPEGVERGWPDAVGLTDESISEVLPEVEDRIVDKIINKALK